LKKFNGFSIIENKDHRERRDRVFNAYHYPEPEEIIYMETKTINTKLVESLVAVIRALSQEERSLLESKLFGEISEPSTPEIMQLAEKGSSFDFLYNEPDLYTLEDGEPSLLRQIQ
jgi:hypothetical protein